MDLSGDDLAGVVDLFGGLTRAELDDAVAELAFKRGEDLPPDALEAAVEDAVAGYELVAVEATDETDEPLLVPGPTAFPALPDGATDLPHIMDVGERSVDRETVAQAARVKLFEDAYAAVEAGDAQAATRLVDVSYDLEAWGPIDAGGVRAELEDV